MMSVLELLVLLPVVAGGLFGILCLVAAIRLRLSPAPYECPRQWPGVTILKPICGLGKGLERHLRSACRQEYPDFQVVLCVQDRHDPAVPMLEALRREFGPDRVSVAIDESQTAMNGKIKILLGALPYARHDILIISDSDIFLPPDYLKTIVAPLSDPEVGCACTLWRAKGADTWCEKMELLSLNADFMANVIFAEISGASKFCTGASVAIRRSVLEEIGGLEALGDYLVEDYEMGRRILQAGKKIEILPYFVETTVDLRTPLQWWHHQVYWDQNTRCAQPLGFFATVLIRAVPFALLFAVLRLGDPAGLAVLGGTLFMRWVTVAGVLRFGLEDREGLRCLWLLPLRDVIGLVTWLLAFTKKRTVWADCELVLTSEGRIVSRQERSGKAGSQKTPKERMPVVSAET